MIQAQGHFYDSISNGRSSYTQKNISSVPKWPVYGRARPSRRAFVENSPSKARIFVILPVYM